MVPLAGSYASVQHPYTCKHSVLRGLKPTARRYTLRATAVSTTHSSRAVSESPLVAAATESADTAESQPAAATEVIKEVAAAVETAVTAASDSPRLELTPMQSVAGQILPGSVLGEWRDHSTSQGYVAKPWQQQQRWQQRRWQQQMLSRSRNRQQDYCGSTAYRQQQQQTGHDRPQQQQRQQQQQWWHVLNNSVRSRAVAQSLASAASPNVLLQVLRSARADDAGRRTPRLPNIRHIATACRGLVDLKRQQQQRRRQRQQRNGSSAQDADISGLLQVIDELLTEQLQDVAAAAVTVGSDPALAAAAGDVCHSSSSSTAARAAAITGPNPALAISAARCLSTVVYSWGKLQHKPPTELLLLVIEGFLKLLEQQQQQQQLGQNEALQQRQQQHSRDSRQVIAAVEASDVHSSILPEGSGTSSSSSSSSSSSNNMDQHKTQALSNLVWGLGKLGFTTDKPYHSSSSSSATAMPQRRRQQQSVRLQQCQQQQRYWSRLAAVAIQQVHPGTAAAAASAIDITSICYGFAAGGYRDVALWGVLAPRVMTYMDEFMPQGLSQILWAYATVGVPHQGVFTAATPTAVQLMPGFAPQGLVNILWAYQTLFRSVPEKLLAAATAECITRSSSGSSSSSSGLGLVAFGPLNLSMLVWVYTKSRSISPTLSAAISRSAIDLLDSFQPSDLCRLLGGLAVIRSLDNSLLDAAESRLLGWLESGSVDIQVVCQGVWAYAVCNHPAGVRLLQPLLDLAAKRPRYLMRSGDSTARLLNILALLRYRDDAFVSLLAQTIVVAAAAAPRPAGAEDPPVTGSITSTAAAAAAAAVSAVSKGGLAATPTPPAAATTLPAAPAAVNPLTRWDAKNLVGIAASLAKLGHTDASASDLLRLIIQGFVDRLPSTAAAAAGSGSGKRQITAAAAAGGSDVQYPCADHTQIKISDHVKISSAILANSILLLWCAAVCDMRKDIGLLLLLAAPVQYAVGSELSAKTLAQLVQVYLWAQTLGPAGKPLISALPKPLMDQALFFWQYELVPTTIHSSLHSEVLSELYALKLRPTKEGVTPDGMFSVDCIVKFKGCDVALEVMGAEHYSVNKVDDKIESRYNTVTSNNNDSAAAEPQQDLDTVDKLSRTDDNISNGRNNNKNKRKSETEGLSASAQGSGCGGSDAPQHVLLGPEVFRMRLLAARGYALATVSAFEWETVRSRGGAKDLLLHKLEEAVHHHQVAAAAAGSHSGHQQQQQTKKNRRKSKQQHQLAGKRGPGNSQDSSSSSSTEVQQQQQQQAAESASAIQQQVAHLMKQQGHSFAVIKGRLSREQYWQQRTSMEQQGRLLLNMAVPWTAAKSKNSAGSSSSSSSSGGGTSTRGESDGGSEVLLEAPSLNDSDADSSSSSSSNGVGDGALATITLDDSEFDLALDLDDLLVDTPDAPGA